MSAQVGASLWLGVFEGRLRACFAGLAGQVAACGAACYPAGVCASKLGGLLDEATARALRPASSQVGAVRQRAELAVFEPAAAGAVTRAAAAECRRWSPRAPGASAATASRSTS